MKKTRLAVIVLFVAFLAAMYLQNPAWTKVTFDPSYNPQNDPVVSGEPGLGRETLYAWSMMGSYTAKVVGQVLDTSGKPITNGSATLVSVLMDSLDMTGRTETKRGYVIDLDEQGRFAFFVKSLPNNEWPRYEAFFISIVRYEAYVEFFKIDKVGKYIIGPITLAKEKGLVPVTPGGEKATKTVDGLVWGKCEIKSDYEDCVNVLDPLSKRISSVSYTMKGISPNYWSVYMGFYMGLPYRGSEKNNGLGGIWVGRQNESEAITFTYFWKDAALRAYVGGIGVGDVFNDKLRYLAIDHGIPSPFVMALKTDHWKRPIYMRLARVGDVLVYFYYDGAINWAKYEGPVREVDTVKLLSSGRNSIVTSGVYTK